MRPISGNAIPDFDSGGVAGNPRPANDGTTATTRRAEGTRVTDNNSTLYRYYSYSRIAQSEVFQSPSTKTQGMFVSKSVSSANEMPTVPLPLSASAVTSVTVRGVA